MKMHDLSFQTAFFAKIVFSFKAQLGCCQNLFLAFIEVSMWPGDSLQIQLIAEFSSLLFTTLWANSADDKLLIFFFFFLEKRS